MPLRPRFRFLVGVTLAALVTLPAMSAPVYRAKTADKYPSKQKQGDVVVAVKAFVSDKDQVSAFGNTKPYKHGVVPLLLVISNRGRNSYSLEKMQVRFITGQSEGLEPLSADDLVTLNPKGHQPSGRKVPLPVPGLGAGKKVRKGPLNRDEIRQNAFVAPIVTPESTASGFMFYYTGTEESLKNSFAYITGIYDITDGKDLFYFEIPLKDLR